MITIDKFKEVFPHCKNPDTWYSLFESKLPEHGIESDEQINMFLAQTGHESGQFNTLEENLNYSGDRLLVVFPKYFKGRDVSSFNRNPEAIANVVYAGRMGNGNEASGDGYKFRGRGILQVTGRSNYTHCSQFIYNDDTLVQHPELLKEPEAALGSAIWFWSANNLVNETDFVAMTKKINGGTIGLNERQALLDALNS